MKMSAVRFPFIKEPSVCVLPSLSYTSTLSACASSLGAGGMRASDSELMLRNQEHDFKCG
jgi:hypothetical protein